MTTTRARSTRTALRRKPRVRVSPPPAVATDLRQILLATDGSKASAAAIRIARVMEEAGEWAPQALTVREHVPVAVADVMLPAPGIVMDDAIDAGALRLVRRQLHRWGNENWPLQDEWGSPAPTIVDVAKRKHADLVVLGLGRHGKLARLFGAETAARVCRLSSVPVFAVDVSAKRRPRTIVVAMDFGPSSLRAAREAVRLVEPGGRVHLIHVRWAIDGRTVRDAAWEQTYAMGVEQGCLRLAGQLRAGGHRVTWELRLGGVLESILSAAKEVDADVIAVGSHNQNVVDRFLLGSTPATLLRAARCSVLVTPPSAG